MRLLLPVGVICTLLLSACTPENRIYEKHQSLSPDIEWLKEDVKTFEVNIMDPKSTYQFNIAFRYAQGYPWNEARVIMEEISPSGEKSTNTHSLKVRESNGEYIGEPGFDIWDSTHLIDPEKEYNETGKYTYIISHDMPKVEFPFAMEVGLIIDKNQP